MSGDPPSEPPEDGEGEEREKREESPDRSADETADPDRPEPEAADAETRAEDDGSDREADAEEPAGERADGEAPDEDDDADRAEAEGAEAGDQGPEDGDGDSEGEGPPEDEEDGTPEDDAPGGESEDEDSDEEGDDPDEGVSEDDGDDDEEDGEDQESDGEDEVEDEEGADADKHGDEAVSEDDEGADADEDGNEDDGEDEESDAEDEDSDAEDEDSDDEDEDGPTANTSVEMHDDTTPIERKTGPASDTEQPLADHIEEMIKRLAVVVIVAGGVSLLAFPFGEDFIIFLWYSVLPSDISQPHVYHPLELVMTQLKAASLLGLVLALPVFVYETYAFMRPGLYPHERRYYLAAVPTSLVLASVGLLFGYFLVLPAVMTYFLYYSRDVVDIAFALGQTFDLMLILLGYLAVVFQIPLFIMLAIMMGLTTRTWLEDRRLIFWGAFLGISFLFSPDPTGMAPIIVAATMVGLFEGTLMLLRWTGR